MSYHNKYSFLLHFDKNVKKLVCTHAFILGAISICAACFNAINPSAAIHQFSVV